MAVFQTLDFKMNRLGFLFLVLISSYQLSLAQFNKRFQAQHEIDAGIALNYMEQKQYDQAIRYWLKAIAGNRKNTDYQYELALAYVAKEDFKKAIPYLEKVQNSKKAVPEYCQLLGNCYDYVGDTAKARKTFLQGTKKYKQSAKLNMELAILDMKAKDQDAAIDHLEDGISVEPSYLLQYFYAGKIYQYSTEKVWSVLFSELFMNADTSWRRNNEASQSFYNSHRMVMEDYFKTYNAEFSKAQYVPTSNDAPDKVYFESLFNTCMTLAADSLFYNRDFELPVASLDTMRRKFLEKWVQDGNDIKFPNPVIDRQKTILKMGLFTAYTYWLCEWAKPLETEEYLKTNKSDYVKIRNWIKKNPLEITAKNKFSRYVYAGMK